MIETTHFWHSGTAHLHSGSNTIFGLDLNLKNLNHFTGIWKRLKVTVRGPLP